MYLLVPVLSIATGMLALLGAMVLVQRICKLVRRRRWCRIPSEQKRSIDKIASLKVLIQSLESCSTGECPLAASASSSRWAAQKELDIAELAGENRVWHRSFLHAKIGSELAGWSDRLRKCSKADDREGTATRLILSGFEHLTAWRLVEAESCFQQICEWPGFDIAAKAISLRAHSWILDFWGLYSQAETETRQAAELCTFSSN